jgi:UDP-2,3-diacylglucosamine pyrophosphatase LpxH
VSEQVRSVFISDVHLGTRACQADRLLAFLRRYESEHVFLLGDIIDFWAMNRSVAWTPSQNTVVQKILRRARHGQRVVFVPGNHDEALRDHVDISFGGIEVVERYVHTGADGRRYLLIHGDEFDQVTRYHRWVAKIGDVAYETLVRMNTTLSAVRRTMHMQGYWSLAGYAKHKVKRALEFMFHFEHAVVRFAKQHGFDGVICGHVHCAASKTIDGVHYLNCGDWVDSCTGIVEHMDGRMEVIRWHLEEPNENVVPLRRPALPAPAAERGARGGQG